jgi:hypothetical protein
LLWLPLAAFGATANPATTNDSDRSDWWSLKPLVRPTVPASTLQRFNASTNPIDALVLARLDGEGLRPSPEADRRTLIRRLTFDLIGLPPTPEEIESFLADTDPQAYEKLVDRLLASPRHGERWARHWLDVVHFGETHGYDKDKPRPNAWPYRDYVIRAFNEDKPYARFVQEQVAGDALFPGTRDGIEALGFIAAGPWDLIGHEEVPESKIDGKIARHLDRDDMVANTIQTFNSLTVQCAQCHNHKFDPIPQEDYYSLQAVFAALDRTDRKYDTDPAVAKKRAALEAEQAKLLSRRMELDEHIAVRAGKTLTELEKKIGAAEKSAKKGDAFGYHSTIEKTQDAAKWVQVDLGRPVALDRVVLHPCKDDFNNIGEGFGFPSRFKIEVSGDADFNSAVELVAGRTDADFQNPGIAPQSFDAGGRAARFVRVTATKLALRQNDYIFALAELDAITDGGTNAALGASVTALDSIEAPPRWRKSNLTDGWYPGVRAAESAELVVFRAQRTELLAQATLPDERSILESTAKFLSSLKEQKSNLPPQSVAYVGAVHTGSGSFVGTGATGGTPRPIHVLNRGNVQTPGREVGPGALSCVAGLPSRFALAASHSEGDRRAALAHWLTSTNNPLTWRSIVNRVWQYHFGRGLVETPNDFGRMGSRPSHPELLDWLACELRDGGQSLKALHRLIVTSATYRQASSTPPTADGESGKAGKQESGHRPLSRYPAISLSEPSARRIRELDPDNRLLWRQHRRKLEAEAVRDTVLFVSGKLDLRMGGPSFRDFVIDKPEHSPHYEYHLHDPEDPKSHRRSIYRFIVRSQPQPFMTTLDCADPSMQVGRRNESVSPLQALTLLNNALMVTMPRHFAAKLERAEAQLPAQVRRAHYEALGRPPTAEEERALTAYARQHGLANLCRVLFNLNEFSFVD